MLFTMHKGYFSAFSTDYAISYFSTMALQSRQHPICLKFKQISVVCLVFGLQMMPGAPVFGASATSGALRLPVQPISGLHGFPLFMPPMAPLLGFATPENGTLTSPIVSKLEGKVSNLESELKQCKEDRRKLVLI